MDFILLLASRFSEVVGKILIINIVSILLTWHCLICQPSILARVVFNVNFVSFPFFLSPVYTTDF